MKPKRDFDPTESEVKCKKPCKKMTNKVFLQPFNQRGGGPSSAKLTLKFEKEVKFEKKIVSHTWFDFIIDVGSSLGLWLGLSALGITDKAIEAFMVAKKWLKFK